MSKDRHIEYVANVELPPGKRQHHIKCIIRERGSERGMCLSVLVEDNGLLVWTCHACGVSGYAFPSGQRLGPPSRLATTPRKLATPSTLLGAPSGLPPVPAACWGASRPITPDTPAAEYLRARGCPLPPPGSHLKWHPRMRDFGTGFIGPALLALITDPLTGAPTSLHTTWIDVSGKLNGPRRKYWKRLPKRGVCRLWPDGELHGALAVGEGIETALSLSLLTGAAWAAVDAGNLSVVPVLPGVSRLSIAVDHDRAGLRSAHALGSRWREAGAEVRYLISPMPDDDLNDVLRRAGRDGLRQGLDDLNGEQFHARFLHAENQ